MRTLLAGIEPATTRLTAECSNQLSYSSVIARVSIPTPDILYTCYLYMFLWVALDVV